jgi:hypothetical protein
MPQLFFPESLFLYNATVVFFKSMTTDYMVLKLALLFPRAPTVLEHRTHNSTKMLYEPRIVKEQKTKTNKN